MIQVKITARWGEKNLETGEPIESGTVDLQFSEEDMEGDQIQVWETFKLAWAAIRGNYMSRTHGPKWYMKELKETVEKSGAVWRS